MQSSGYASFMKKIENNDTVIEIQDVNRISFSCKHDDGAHEYAFYVYKDNQIVSRTKYSTDDNGVFWAVEEGKYKIKIFYRPIVGYIKGMAIDTFFTEEVYFPGLNFTPSIKKQGLLKQSFINTATVLKEILINLKRIYRLSRYDYLLKNKDSYLGKVWDLLTPLIKIGTFWFVFGIGIRNGRDVDGIPFVVWMLCGLIPWFFFSGCLVHGANSIYSRANTVLKIKYPISTIPIEEIFVQFYEHSVVLIILFVTLFYYGFFPNMYWLNLLYYVLYEVFFLSAFSMLSSALTMVARDFQKMLGSVIQLWFYITPILWSMENLPLFVQKILKLNPALYIVEGFRDSLIYDRSFIEHPYRLFFMWVLNTVLLIVGANVQVRFRDRFSDML